MARWVDGYAIGTFSCGADTFVGLVTGDQVVRLEPASAAGVGPLTVRAVLEQWELWGPRLGELARTVKPGHGVPLTELVVHAPHEPRQILQAGANYRSHVVEILVSGREPGDTRSDKELRASAEDLMDARARNGTPFFFSGLPAAMTGPDDRVVLPAESQCVDWEAELAVVLGRKAHRVSREQAMDCVAGYTVCNDISARDLQFPTEHKLLGGDWIRAKNRPTFLPTGPFVVPAALVPDYRDLEISFDLNGERMQSDKPANLLFDVESLIVAASAATVLYPGDLILTGSPAGNGGYWKRWLRPGDVLEASISRIGSQRNVCVAE
ncbi:fumarylacetoacetate hydrolase family protein [Nocardia beijingensis]|uniref:fumarylacetoacetate hydrolase family protein n=1 Tax=Nocardia beijingensis TaxID=95162 RepID=UPI00332DB58D